MKDGKQVVSFLGLGNVGSAVYEVLNERYGVGFIIKRALVRDLSKDRGVPKEILTDDPNEILNDAETDIVAEFMGGVEPAWQYLDAALRNGKNVVTANKAALAAKWGVLNESALKAKKGIYFEAACCAGIPVIRALKGSLQDNRINSVLGIVNGSSNYILTKMKNDKLSLEAALALASAKGYTEPDPSVDLDGYDVANKLSILLSLAAHTKISVDDVFTEGMMNLSDQDIKYGQEMGLCLKFLAIGKRDGNNIQARVHPTFIPAASSLAAVNGAYNAVMINGDIAGPLMFYGLGAGKYPTASAIVSDILNAAAMPDGMHDSYAEEVTENAAIRINDDWASEYFLRVDLIDKPGMMAKAAEIFGKCGVSLAKVIQTESNYNNYAPVVFLTHNTLESNIQKVINSLKTDLSEECRIGSLIRIERDC